MELASVVAQTAMLAQQGNDQLGASGVVALHLIPEGRCVAVITGEEEVVCIGHGDPAGLVLGTGGAVKGSGDAPGLQRPELPLNLAPQVTDHHVMGLDEVHILLGEGIVLQNALFVIAEYPFTLQQLHLRDGGLAVFDVQMGGIHTLGRNGLLHDFSVDVIAHRAGIGGLAPQTNGIDRHVDGAAAGIRLSVFNIVVEVNAVTSNCCQFHRGCLLSGSVRCLRRMLEKRTISGRAADLKNSTGTLL